MSIRYPISFNSWEGEETLALQDVIASGQFTCGPKVKAFETAFAAYHGIKYAVMTNSGSSAILVAVASAVRAGKFKRGDEIIVPALAWVTTYTPFHQYGLKLKVVDIDPNTLGVDVEEVRRAITSKTRAIVGVSILGNPAGLAKLRDLADKHKFFFFEDNCESVGARLDRQLTGTFGHLSIVSFFFSHHISTMEGGMLLTNDRELYELALAIRAYGWARDIPGAVPKTDDFPESYRFLVPGYNVRPLEFAGAVGLEQIKKFEVGLAARRKNLSYFKERIAQDKRFHFPIENGASSSFSFPLVIKPESGLVRSKVLAQLREQGIEFRMITGGNIVRHDVAKHLDLEVQGSLPQANWIHDQGFFVGNGPLDLRPQLEHFFGVLAHHV